MKKKIVFICIAALPIAVVGIIVLFLFLRPSPEEAGLAPAIEATTPEPALAELPPEPPPASEPEPKPESVPPPEPAPEPEHENAHVPGQNHEPEPEPQPATDITDELTVSLSDGRQPATLLDRDYTTRLVFGQDKGITLNATMDIHSLYLIWSLPPGQWTVSGAETQVFGENGFIHEYVTLASTAQELTITLPQDGAALCDIYAFAEGTPPEWVQTWLPPLFQTDLLAFPTHADDEHLFFVGVLPYYAGERGYRVQVAYLTNHWNQPPRPHELLNGLWAVGIRNYPIISGFNDRYAETLQQATNIYGFDNFVNFQVELIRRFRPYVVVGHDLNGEYGHGVHMLGAHALRAAVENAADSTWHTESYEQYGTWNTQKLYLHLYRENAIMMDWDIPLENFGGATAYEMAVRGYEAHRSQHRWAFAVPRPGSVSGHRFGLVRSLVGEDVIGNDMFENIVN